MGVALRTVNLIVSDMERSLAFYQGLLGLAVDDRSAPPRMILLDVGAGAVKLSLDTHTHGGQVPGVGGVQLGLETDDVDGLHRRMRDFGLEPGEVREYSYGRSFDAHDPDGHPLTVYRSR